MDQFDGCAYYAYDENMTIISVRRIGMRMITPGWSESPASRGSLAVHIRSIATGMNTRS